MALPQAYKRWLHLCGSLLSLAGLVFLFFRLQSYAGQLDLSRLHGAFWSLLGALSLFYGAGNLLLARAWWRLLLLFTPHPRWPWALRIYGQSQIAKYVPGNLFHLAGRQTFAMAEGLPAGAVAKSVLWELGLITLAGALFGTLTIPLFQPAFPAWMSSALFCFALAGLLVLLGQTFSSSVAAALWLLALFLVLSGGVFVLIVLYISEATTVPAYSALCGAYVTAWLAGFVTPGAPAGVGVREMVLLFLLQGTLLGTDLLLAILLARGVTVAGDFCYFAGAMLTRNGK